MIKYDAPATFRGQLQRGRGSARRCAHAEAKADVAVYERVIDDSRWDRQTEKRDSYLAGLYAISYTIRHIIFWPPDRAEADRLDMSHPVHTLRRLVDAPLPLPVGGSST